MFQASVADFCRFDPATTTSASAYSSSPSGLTTAEYPSLGVALEAIAISHCASQLPEESEERHKMIRSLQQMQNNSHSSDQDNTVLKKNSEREQGNDALLGSVSAAASTILPSSSTLYPLIVDPYRVLQVRRDATPQEIRHSYRRLSLWHHPGRSIHIHTATSSSSSNHTSNNNGIACAERYRRCQVFEILAACYETLLDKESRRRCDGLLRDVEWQRKQKEAHPHVPAFPAGDIRVGQMKNKVAAIAAAMATPTTSMFQRIPTLTPASSSGSSLEGADLPDQESMSLLTQQRSNLVVQQQQHPLHLLAACGIGGVGNDSSEPQLPSLLKNSTSSTTDTYFGGAAMHYSETETNRLYGGPLQLLYRSRRWKPFMDPLELFAQVFGSRAPLGILPEKDWSEWKAQAAAAAAAAAIASSSKTSSINAVTPTVNRSAAWTGSSETLPDGTVVFTTRRTLNDRVMTRTETVRTDQTGRKHSYVSVTSETVLQHDAADEKAKQEEYCHALEYCTFFYRDHCVGGDGTDATTASTATFDKTMNPSHAIVETNTRVETDADAPEADGCHGLGACWVWNPVTSDDEDDNRDDDCDDKKDDYEKQQQEQQQSWGLCGQWFPE
jgi:hypothetical protein